MTKTTVHVNRVIHSPQVLEALIKVVQPHLPLMPQRTRITEEDIRYVLTHASVHRLSLEAASAARRSSSTCHFTCTTKMNLR